MATFSAIVTCWTEVCATVEAATAEEALTKLARGAFATVQLHDGGLAMDERFSDCEVVEESFGEDGA